MNNLAILYINSCHDECKYIKEANVSAASFRQYLPDAKYYLYTDASYNEDMMSNFDVVRPAKFEVLDFMKDRVHLNGQMLVKHRAMLEMEERAVIYVGADTYALKDKVSELPNLLERFELVVAHAPVRINADSICHELAQLPSPFPEMNCDLIVYRNSERVKSMLREWKEIYSKDVLLHAHDQGVFRYLLYKGDLDFYILPPEYNYRGMDYREDTVILQNRSKLGDYLRAGKLGRFEIIFQWLKNATFR